MGREGWSGGSGASRWSSRGQKVGVQVVGEKQMHREGGGEGGEVGDGGGVLRRLDPVLCISVRARLWLESLEWRKDVTR